MDGPKEQNAPLRSLKVRHILWRDCATEYFFCFVEYYHAMKINRYDRHVLGPEIILARGCENVAGKLRQKW